VLNTFFRAVSLTNYFQLFHLPQRFALDRAALDTAYREVAARVHPDKFAGAAQAERRVSMQWATAANEGYAALKSPLKRAMHLLALAGHETGVHSNTAMPGVFLMQQMQWREALADARAQKDEAALEDLEAQVNTAYTAHVAQLEQLLDHTQDYTSAVAAVRELLFIEKFKEEVAQALDALAA
jgi:molecular chaperone HscB